MLLQGDTTQAVGNGITEESPRDCLPIQTRTINFQIMKAKIIITICAIVGALALVFLPAEAPTVELQILWSGSWLFVFWLCAKGIEKYGNYEQ